LGLAVYDFLGDGLGFSTSRSLAGVLFCDKEVRGDRDDGCIVLRLLAGDRELVLGDFV